MEASREVFWNVPIAPLILYPLGLIAAVLIIYAIVHRARMWKIGKPEKRTDNMGRRIWDFIVEFIIDGIFHRRFLRDFYPGLIHFCLFLGGLLLLFGTAMDVVSHYIIPILYGNVYLGVSFAADVGGILMLIGAILATIRRYIQKPERLNTIIDDGVVITLVFVVVISGFFMEAFRMLIATPEHLTKPEFYSHPEWAQWSFGGYFIAGLLSNLSESTRLLWYNIFYWFHAIIAFGSIYYVCLSFTKLSHILVSPINAFLKTYRAKGALPYVNLEAAENFGVNKIENFTWKQILDLDACTNCGRCQDRCPAYLSGKPLSPRKVIQDLKAHWLVRGPEIIKARKNAPKAGEEAQAPPAEEVLKPIIGEVITEDELWSCTTCRACQDICPVFIEHIDKIVDMRRNMVLEQAKMPETGEAILKCIEDRGHTCRGTTATRTEWTQGLDIKLISENKDVDVLFWVGCAPSLEARNMKVAIATAKIMKAAGVNFAILGDEESCCGEPARRLGNEYLYQMQAMRNIEIMKNYNVKKIVTICPHCFNTIKNEYPQFDGKFVVIHHSEFIAELMKAGKIPVAAKKDLKLTFHDSCYLGRHNDIYGQPRQVINEVNKSGIIEMKRSKDQGFCCGGGGGRFWMEERIGKRISEMRVEQIVETKAEVIASACPYCLQMFEDAIKAKEVQDTLKAKDISELVIEAMEKK
jgi:Fe-S oxidoreductase/nitrate reductase gamma subunit